MCNSPQNTLRLTKDGKNFESKIEKKVRTKTRYVIRKDVFKLSAKDFLVINENFSTCVEPNTKICIFGQIVSTGYFNLNSKAKTGISISKQCLEQPNCLEASYI